MSQLFDITVASKQLRLDTTGYGETTFTVTNTSSEALRVATRLVTDNPKYQNWLKIESDSERNFPAKGTHQYRVKIDVPPDEFQGHFNFRLDAYSVEEPEDKFTEGQTVFVEMPPVVKPKPKKGFPWLVAIIVVLVLTNIGSGVALWLLKQQIDIALSKANTAIETANQAESKTDKVQGHADTAVSNAHTALETAKKADSKAKEAESKASQAIDTAKKAKYNAVQAIDKAKQANIKADTVQQTASMAESKATQAQKNADTAVSKANTALETASRADSKADKAQINADTAVSKANTALGTAKTAGIVADKAQENANTAISKTDEAQKIANTAASIANKAIETAKKATIQANQAVETAHLTIKILPIQTRYTDNDDGTVTDNRTRLTWLKNANCFGRQNLSKARRLAKQLKSGKCGLTDGSIQGTWRLPTKAEWETMLDTRYTAPALSNAAGTRRWEKNDAFSSVQSDYYWAASYADGTTNKWNVELNFGHVYPYGKTITGYVWLVRGKQ
ncbi:MAG: hypothetical protein DRR08_23165 [Candidatus Parabeggiatoa sp. nov. 2]|nr:MAG: hypothetical protein B6247_22595 [Beggiatoa sp. 4572_84]RKZ55862.1 MAG: hypothetical protein DRR08_23165 [Gammaproteobacteria bacterium]